MAAPARSAAAKSLVKGSLKYNFLRWYYYQSYFPQLGLRKDDTIMEVGRTGPILKEALRRLPQAELDARNFRIMRASHLSMCKTILPKEQWTDFDSDTPYLKPYMDEVEREFEEKKQWESY